ncbi:insulin-like growth factor I isoform X1 [Periplaneta americana]|uniref:insulin-like growth factor I isoform X1 n=1 Tax=Periplaneta americana TaxID=6978 RepID=UPI0037E8DAC2
MSLLFLVLLASATASPLGRMQLCGSELANKLAEICAVYGYNDPFRHAHYEDSTYDSITPTRTRVKRGVADECCKTGCSQETLEQYCNPPLKSSDRSKVLKVSEDHSINHIPQDDSAASAVLTSEVRRSSIAREEKNDLVSKVRGHHDKKGRRANNRCRCRRRRRRGKGDLEELERHLNKIAPVIGTINPSYLGIPVILPPRIRKEEMSLQDYGTK